MADDGKPQDSKAVEGDKDDEKYVKKRSVTSAKKLELLQKEESELEDKLRKIKKEKKTNELEYNKKLYFLIGKAVWEDLEDTKGIDEAEHRKQLEQLKTILKSKIKTKADKDLLDFKKLI